MALVTLGTTAQTTLQALLVSDNMNAADLAALTNLILNDKVNSYPSQPIFPGAFGTNRHLFPPNRLTGILRAAPGDYIAVDASGWPILISANAIANGASWVHT